MTSYTSSRVVFNHLVPLSHFPDTLQCLTNSLSHPIALLEDLFHPLTHLAELFEELFHPLVYPTELLEDLPRSFVLLPIPPKSSRTSFILLQTLQTLPIPLAISRVISSYPGSKMSSNPETGTSRYRLLRQSGQHLQKCMKDADVYCKIPASTLSIKDLADRQWYIMFNTERLPRELRERAFALGYPKGKKDFCLAVLENSAGSPGNDCWQGRIAKGVIFIETIERELHSRTSPWISSVTQAVYEQYFPMESLRHVFVTDIANAETDIVVRALYENRLPAKWNHHRVTIWDESNQDFPVILASRIGKVLAYMVLGAFARGTRRIVRIATWYSRDGLQMRFDLE